MLTVILIVVSIIILTAMLVILTIISALTLMVGIHAYGRFASVTLLHIDNRDLPRVMLYLKFWSSGDVYYSSPKLLDT